MGRDMGVTRLLERDAELASLREAVEAAARRDGGQAIVIEGPAGIGKTALLEAATELAAEHGVRALSARGGEFERDFPFGVARQLFECPLVSAEERERERLLSGAASHASLALGLDGDAEAATLQGPDLPFTVVHGIYWLVANLAEREPLLLAVDDLHWCDEPSLRALAYLAPRLAEHPCLLVVGLRTGEPDVSPLVSGVVEHAQPAHLAPAPLGPEAAAKLLGQVFEGAPLAPEFTQACLEASGGNPYLLRELAASARSDGVTPDADGANAVRGVAPASVVRSTLLRIGRLPKPCAELARTIAALGTEVEPRHAAALAGLPVDEVAKPLEALTAAGILARGLPLRFAHPLIHEAIHSELPEATSGDVRARAARLLRDEGADPIAIAHHLLGATKAGDPLAVETLREAAREMLTRGAPETAHAYLERALAEPPDPADRATIEYELGLAGWLAARDLPATLAHLQAGVEGAADEAERAARVIGLARARAGLGDVVGAFDLLDEALDRAEAAGVGAELTDPVLAEHGAIGLLHPETHERARRRLAEAAPDGDSRGELLALAVLATARANDGSAQEAAELAERALADNLLLETEGSDSIAFYVAVYVLIMTDHHDSAAAHLREAHSLARRSGSAFAFASVSAMRAVLAWRRGESGVAVAEARSGIEPGLMHPFTYPLLYTCLGLALADRGELKAAEEAIAATGVGPDLPELLHVNTSFYARGELRMAQGRWEDALEDFRELERRDARVGVRNPTVPWRPAAVEACMRLDRAEEAAELAQAEEEFAERWGTATARGQALRARGLAQGTDGVDVLREAIDVLAEAPARRERVLALCDLGEALRRAGARKDAREVLTQAVALAQECGLTRLAARAHEELKVAGAKPRRLQFSGADSLTAAERRVTELAAGGMANKEIAETLFLSPRTVENHLSRVYRKLDIGSREELPDALAMAPAE
jgi:DNA-binding CsgD family transcriptional regulator